MFANCGNALNELERKEEAVQRFKRCLEINPSHAGPPQHGQLPARSEVLEEALEHYSFQISLSMKPRHALQLGVGLAVARALGSGD